MILTWLARDNGSFVGIGKALGIFGEAQRLEEQVHSHGDFIIFED